MGVFSAYDNGIGFANAFRLLLTRASLSALILNGSYTDATLIMPTIVNGALACELFLKALINEKCKGHSLLELLDEVEQRNVGTKQRLQDLCISLMITKKGDSLYNIENYEKDLKQFNKAFVILRYWHEPRTTSKDSYNLDFLEVLVVALQVLCVQKFGPRPNICE